VLTRLAALGRIDSVQPYPLAVDFDGVGVDHGGDADDIRTSERS
jgi:hypothetical protein